MAFLDIRRRDVWTVHRWLYLSWFGISASSVYMTVREAASRPSIEHKCAETIYVHNEGCQSVLSGVYTCHAENHDRRIQTQEFPSVGLHFPNAKILVVIVKCEIPNKQKNHPTLLYHILSQKVQRRTNRVLKTKYTEWPGTSKLQNGRCVRGVPREKGWGAEEWRHSQQQIQLAINHRTSFL